MSSPAPTASTAPTASIAPAATDSTSGPAPGAAGEIPMVRSYVRDAWFSPDDSAAAVTVLDPSTGAPLARVAPSGLDMARARGPRP